MSHERHGAKQPNRFDPARAAILDDPARFAYVPVEALLELLDIPAGGTLVDLARRSVGREEVVSFRLSESISRVD